MQHIQTQARFNSRRPIITQPYLGTWLNKPLALIAFIPCLLIEVVIAVASLFKPTKTRWFAGSRQLLNVITGQLSLCGLREHSIKHHLSVGQIKQLQSRYQPPKGVFDLPSVHAMTGLAVTDPMNLYHQQFNGNSLDYFKLCLKGLFCLCFYQQATSQTRMPNNPPSLFGMRFDNLTMQEAVEWATEYTSCLYPCQSAFFINANSANLACANPNLRHAVNHADRIFVDGSGMRLAAQSAGFQLKDNINGTDMLPHLCEAAAREGKSIYLLGAKPGVAAKMAENLKKQYPRLKIAGQADGYFSQQVSMSVVETINASQANILLVALGSPHQEQWLMQHAQHLKCDRALAVGGLFDFFSGNIARAPMWMRELGLEWVWRLMQEPISKFERYVIGTPLFLFRVFVLNQHKRGY